MKLPVRSVAQSAEIDLPAFLRANTDHHHSWGADATGVNIKA
jgi:hypothetical protein